MSLEGYLMNQALREEINKLADAIISHYHIQIPIQGKEDMQIIVEKIGGHLRYSDFTLADGEIMKIGDSFEITIAEYMSDNRQVFTIAHELGHLFLHMGYAIDSKKWSSNENNIFFRNLSGEMEFQAHEFAAALLMPVQQFYKKMQECYLGLGRYNMYEIARYFSVSEEAAYNRAKWLGIIPWR